VTISRGGRLGRTDTVEDGATAVLPDFFHFSWNKFDLPGFQHIHWPRREE